MIAKIERNGRLPFWDCRKTTIPRFIKIKNLSLPLKTKKMKRAFRFLSFLILLSTLSHTNLGATSSDSLRHELRQAGHDTTRIKVLFALGRQFIDGPSDSLLFYYQNALHIIHKNLQNYPDRESTSDDPLHRTFKNLELRALIELGIEYFYRSDYNLALEYYFAAAEVAIALNDVSHLSECYGEIGIVYKNQGRYDEALDFQTKAINIAYTLNEPDWTAICNNNIGNIYKAKGFYSLAIDYYLKALNTFREMNQPRRMANCMQSVGTLFLEQQNHQKALEYYQQALEISLETGDRIRQINLKMSIGNTLAEMGQTKLAKKNYFEVLQIYDSTGYLHGIDDCYKLLGLAYLDEQNADSAALFFDKALTISKKENDLNNMAEIYGKQGMVYLEHRNFDLALAILNKSDSLARVIGAPDLVMDAALNLYHLHQTLGKADVALKHYVHYATMKDSLFKEAQYRAITEMEIKYESVKSEQDIAMLRQKTTVQELIISRRNRLLWSAAIIFVVLIVGGYFYYQNRRLKAVQKAAELENRLLRAQMNPHFIFNSLIAIQGFIYEKNPVEAGDFLAKFANLIRLTLENSRSEFVSLEKEIDMLKVYLQLQQVRYQGKFIFEINVDENLDPENLKIPPMLAQPFIENAVEHGIRHKAEKGCIKILFQKENKNIRVIVEDDGVGREAAMKLRKKDKPQSLAISITRERLKILGKKYKQKFMVQVSDLKDANGQPLGTRVELTMPVQDD
ncbi:MAG: tetratricopeptide repeat protein [Clostridia bacterium]|nr:tetratricopeptide repeat protein [Clostridia bacterium]